MLLAIIFCVAILIPPLALDAYIHGRDSTLRNAWSDVMAFLARRESSSLQQLMKSIEKQSRWRRLASEGVIATLVVAGGTAAFWEVVMILVRFTALTATAIAKLWY